MIQTKFGNFDGDSWEGLCQLVFKLKYGDQNYQEMPASPGDFGIEGFIKNDGVSFQCYCPDFHYTQKELYEKQRDKITADLGKLKKYESEIFKRIGEKKIKEWIFLTPTITDNNLLKHAQSKQNEVKGWSLQILDIDFKVVLKDVDFYAKEINEIQVISGKKIIFLEPLAIQKSNNPDDVTEYEKNISRKNEKRCTFNGTLHEKKHIRLNELTSRKWIEGEEFLKKIEKEASEIFFQIARQINQYEDEVGELSITWQGEPEELISKVRNEICVRIREAIPSLGEAERYKIADHMTSKWLAICPLEIE